MARPAGRNVVPTVAALALVAGCSSFEPVDGPYSMRVAALGGRVHALSGASMALDPPGKPITQGDQMDLHDDLGIVQSSVLRGVVEARVTEDDEVRVTFERVEDASGGATLGRFRTFDGAALPPGTRVNSNLDWNRTTLSYAHRLFAIRGDGLPIDVLARVGAERDQYMTDVFATGRHGDRFVWAPVPFAGLETRVGLADRWTLVLSADAGHMDYGDKRTSIGDAGVELRWNVLGPVDLSIAYELSSRHVAVLRSTGERSDLRVTAGEWLVGVALRF